MSARRKFGLTWWGQRWISALEALSALYANRLPRGRTYARKGAVTNLKIAPGSVTALVKGSRAQPYRVTLTLPTFPDDVWQAVIARLADAIAHAAALLDGRVPDDIDDVMGASGVSLFPRTGELRTRCSCPDVANPCKHVAAVHYLLAETFDSDPFLLPALRGRDRHALLAGLRAARAGDPLQDQRAAPDSEPLRVDSLQARALWDARGALGAIRVRPARPSDPGALLRRLGPPPAALAGNARIVGRGLLTSGSKRSDEGVEQRETTELWYEDVVAAAAELAWRLATRAE